MKWPSNQLNCFFNIMYDFFQSGKTDMKISVHFKPCVFRKGFLEACFDSILTENSYFNSWLVIFIIYNYFY